MIRLRDSITLASTKLRARRLRTGVTVGISGILFGLILAVVLVIQGVFESVDRFSDEGLNDRYVMTVTRHGGASFDLYDNLDNVDLVRRVEKVHAALIAKKQVAAKRYAIEYNPKVEDPSPVMTDKTTGRKMIREESMDIPIVSQVVSEIAAEKRTSSFDINKYIAPYSSAKLLGRANPLAPATGQLAYMKDGKESQGGDRGQFGYMGSESEPSLSILPGSLSESFITNQSYDPAAGEIPVIVPYSSAEKLLKFPPLKKNATDAERLERLTQVRQRVSEVQAAFCYRNEASQALLHQAVETANEIERNKNNQDYQKPSLIYTVPSASSCGAVTVKNDTRTAEEKQIDANRTAYEKEIGVYAGEPEQHKVAVRGVGISADPPGNSGVSSIADIAHGLLSSSLGYGEWHIPGNLLEKIPEISRPDVLFGAKANEPASSNGIFTYEAFYVEFSDEAQARRLLDASGFFGAGESDDVYVAPFGSGSFVLEEMRRWFDKILFWATIVVSAVAAIILSGMIGRTIADGRKETAVFRAIGAKRSDIASIYSVYTILLSLRVVLFALVLGLVIAFVVDTLAYKDATIGAQLAFAAVDTTKQFHFIDFGGYYIPAIAGVVMAVGMISMILPLLRNARRSPINDMRDDN